MFGVFCEGELELLLGLGQVHGINGVYTFLGEQAQFFGQGLGLGDGGQRGLAEGGQQDEGRIFLIRLFYRPPYTCAGPRGL